MTLEILQHIWFLLVGILLAGYAILDGFDLGVGSLLPFLAKNEQEKETLLMSIWPFWDGNEVWLLTGGGALFAAFPHAYATVFSGFYIPLMLVVFALILRAVSLEFRFYDEKRRTLWDRVFITGSLLPSLLYGVALGNVVLGIPMDDAMNYTGSFLGLLHPFALVCGLTGLTAILIQGAAYTGLKNQGPLRDRATRAIGLLTPALTVLVVTGAILSFFLLPERITLATPWLCAVAVILIAVIIRISAGKGHYPLTFILSSGIFMLLLLIAASLNYPYLVHPADGTVTGITIFNGSSGEKTLRTMLYIAVPGMPVVIAYSAYVYRIFRGKGPLYSHG